MITLNKLKLFKQYKGDGDVFVRIATKKEKDIIDYSDWEMIDELLQDVGLINKGLVSDDYRERINNKLEVFCDSQNTIKELINLSKAI